MKAERIIAIDPDVDKSGVAELHVPTRLIEATTLSFADLMDYLQYVKANLADKDESVVVIVEAGWMNESNWHIGMIRSIASAAKTGLKTGRNHEVARKIAEMSRHYGLETKEVKPMRKCWKGKNGKITHDELCSLMEASGIASMLSRTNQEIRDSVLLSLVYSGIPLKAKAGKI